MIFFWYLPTYVMHAKILAHIRDYKRQFYSNCQTLTLVRYQDCHYLAIFLKLKQVISLNAMLFYLGRAFCKTSLYFRILLKWNSGEAFMKNPQNFQHSFFSEYLYIAFPTCFIK